jgi:mono/diheme cytochrome c family protein
LWLGLGISLSGCSEHGEHSDHAGASSAGSELQRSRDFARIANGQALFTQHCAVCHGEQAQGDPDWRYRDESGHFPPPPLNGTAHAWHHPWQDLHRVIRDGQNNMPAWDGVLTEAEIDDTIAWFQSLWPDEVYAAWHVIDSRARSGR